jgi:hypothetical protein
MTAFWDVALYSLEIDRRFRGASCLNHQGDDAEYAPLKRRSTSRLRGAASQKAVMRETELSQGAEGWPYRARFCACSLGTYTLQGRVSSLFR